MKIKFLLLALMVGFIPETLSTPAVKQLWDTEVDQVDMGANKRATYSKPMLPVNPEYSQQYSRVRLQSFNKASVIKIENVKAQTEMAYMTTEAMDTTTVQSPTDTTDNIATTEAIDTTNSLDTTDVTNPSQYDTTTTPARDIEDIALEDTSTEGSGFEGTECPSCESFRNDENVTSKQPPISDSEEDSDVLILSGITPNENEPPTVEDDDNTQDVQTNGVYLYIYHPAGFFQKIVSQNNDEKKYESFRTRSQSYQYQYRYQSI